MSVTFPGPSILRDIQGDEDQQNWRLRNRMPQVPPKLGLPITPSFSGAPVPGVQTGAAAAPVAPTGGMPAGGVAATAPSLPPTLTVPQPNFVSIPDPNDPKYVVQKGIKPQLKALAMDFLRPGSGTEQLEAPRTAYQRDVAHAKDVNSAQDQEEQARQRAAIAQMDLNKGAGVTGEKFHPVMVEDANGDPIPGIQNERTGEVVGPDGKVIANPKTYVKSTAPPKPSAEDDAQRYEKIISDRTLRKPVSPEDAAWAGAYERNKNLGMPNVSAANASSSRIDRSYQYNQSALDKVRTPISTRSERVGIALDNLNRATPASDALAAPEILTALVGGQGSGLRMNEAEISRIVGGRDVWQNLKSKLDAYQTDPSKPFLITPEQRGQMRAILTAAQAKVSQKNQIIEEAEDQLVGTDDPKEHRRIVADAKKKLDMVDAGTGTEAKPQDFGPANGKPEGSTGKVGNTAVVVRNGRVVSQ